MFLERTEEQLVFNSPCDAVTESRLCWSTYPSSCTDTNLMAGKQFIIAHFIYPKIYFLTVAYIPLSSAKRVKVTELII